MLKVSHNKSIITTLSLVASVVCNLSNTKCLLQKSINIVHKVKLNTTITTQSILSKKAYVVKYHFL